MVIIIVPVFTCIVYTISMRDKSVASSSKVSRCSPRTLKNNRLAFSQTHCSFMQATERWDRWWVKPPSTRNSLSRQEVSRLTFTCPQELLDSIQLMPYPDIVGTTVRSNKTRNATSRYESIPCREQSVCWDEDVLCILIINLQIIIICNYYYYTVFLIWI